VIVDERPGGPERSLESASHWTASKPRVAVIVARLEGGAGMLALHGAKVMDAVSTTIITGSGDRLIAEAVEAGLEVVVEPTLRAPIVPHRDLRALRRVETLLREQEFDVVHTHCAKGGAVGRVAAHRAGVPRIVHTFHGFPFHEFQPKALHAAYVTVERQLGRHTDLALCVGSGVAAEAVRRRLIAPDRIRTIGVAVPDEAAAAAAMSARVPLARERARRILGLPANAIVVGAVGRLTYQKAPEDFVTAMQNLQLPDVVGVWVGDGEISARIARQIRSVAVNVVMPGERTDVLSVLPAFDVFALPSLYEGLPTAIVEAMICGVPVVATAVNAVPDIVIPGETGLLVPPRRPDLLAAAIRHLLCSPPLARRLATNAGAQLAGRHTASALRDALTSAYRCGSDTNALSMTLSDDAAGGASGD